MTTGAGFGIRAAARIIDLVYAQALGFMTGIFTAFAFVFLEQMGLIAPGWQERVATTNMADWVFGLLAALLYDTVTEGMYGASLGKVLCKLRVVTEDGQRITMAKAFKRSLLYFWDSLFFGLVGYASMKKSELNQRNGDHWAKTVVVRSSDVPAGAKSGAEVFVLALLMASVGVAVCTLVGLIIRAV